MVATASVLSPVAPAPRGTTARDGAQTRAAMARLSHDWTVTEYPSHPDVGNRVYCHLVIESPDATLPTFRLDRHERAVVLSECDETGTWTLGWFGSLADALAMLRREVLAPPDVMNSPPQTPQAHPTVPA